MSNADLIAKLRDANPHKAPWHLAKLATAAADALEAQAKEIEALDAKVRSLSPHEICACSYDGPEDVCSHHSPKLAAAEAKIAEQAKEIERLNSRMSVIRQGWRNANAIAGLAVDHANLTDARLERLSSPETVRLVHDIISRENFKGTGADDIAEYVLDAIKEIVDV